MSSQTVRAWTPPVPGVREVFHASFAEHAYPGHTHDTWTVLIVDEGDIRYDLDRRHHGSFTSVVTILPPHVVHDGRAGPSGRFRKRNLYLDVTHIDHSLIGHAVDAPTIADRGLRAALDVLHRRLVDLDDPFEAETRLAFITERLRWHLTRRPAQAAPPVDDVAGRVRDLLDTHIREPITLAAVSAQVHTHPTHLVRTFTRRFGVPPHAYLIGRRIEAARRQLLDGNRPGAVAVDLGFYDQAHLTRHFKRHVGTTPGRYREGAMSVR